MTRNLFAILIAPLMAAALTTCGFAQDATPVAADSSQQANPEQEKKAPDIYDESADARADIADALARAKNENRRVLIQWGGNWCIWCIRLHHTFTTNPEVRKTLSYEYNLVLVDAGRNGKNLDLAEEYGADLKNNGYPFLTVLDAEGNVLANQETGSLEAEIDGKPGHSPEKVMAFLTKHQAPYLTAESVLGDGIAKARAEGKRVFLHFGAPWCGWCHRLENWMAIEDVAQVLARDFVHVKIDIDRMIGGKELLAQYRKTERGGIPWFVFLDGNGEVLITSDGPDGNLGCPWSPEEKDAFRKILAEVTVTISNDDINAITEHLGEKKKPAPPEDGH